MEETALCRSSELFQLEKVIFYSIFLNIFVRFYRNFDIITLHRFQTTYQNLFSKFDLDPQSP